MIYPWQSTIWNTIKQTRRSNRLPHALLLSGDQGCGNEAFVETLAHSLLCLSPQASGEACGQCRSCQVYQSEAHPDRLVIRAEEGKKVISVEQVRDLGRFLSLSLSYSHCRVVVIEAAELMNINAANSLLKSLEEPAKNTHLLLLTHQNSKLLPTIRSRCQQLRLPVPKTADAVSWLEIQSTQQDAKQLLNLALGRPLDALKLDQSDQHEKQTQFWQAMIEVLQGKQTLTQCAERWQKYDRDTLINWQLQALQASLRQHYDVSIETNGAYERLLRGLRSWSNERLWHIYDRLIQLKQLSAHPLNQQIFVETMLTYWLDKQTP